MSSVVISGDTSGAITLAAPAVAGTNTITLPASTGTVVTTGSPQSGSVLQVVSTTKTDTFSTSATSMTDITGMSVSITPKFATSKILVVVNLVVGQATGNFAPVNLLRNGTNIAQPTTSSTYQATLNNYNGEGVGYGANTALSGYPLNFLDSPATTSALTYKLQMYTTAGTAYVNTRAVLQNTSTVSTITVMEIAA
jgi:hypothetical protein